MAVTDEGVVVPQPTGAVPGPDGPVTYEQTPGHPVGTGAVEGPDGPVTYEFGPLGTEGTGAVPDPEPVTYVNEAFAKVVRPASGRRAAESTDTAETKQQTADSLPGAQK